MIRKFILRNTGSLLIDEVNYTFHIKNGNGDLDEAAIFTFTNPSGDNIKFLRTQYTSFSGNGVKSTFDPCVGMGSSLRLTLVVN